MRNPTRRALPSLSRPSCAHSPPPSLDSRCFCVAMQPVLYCMHFLPTTRAQTRGSGVSQAHHASPVPLPPLISTRARHIPPRPPRPPLHSRSRRAYIPSCLPPRSCASRCLRTLVFVLFNHFLVAHSRGRLPDESGASSVRSGADARYSSVLPANLKAIPLF